MTTTSAVRMWRSALLLGIGVAGFGASPGDRGQAVYRERCASCHDAGAEAAAASRGSVVALDATTGRQIWKQYTVPDAPSIVGKNAAGTPLWKPAGAAIWAAPTVDLARKVLYVATGNAYTEPAPPTSDAVIAMSLDTGAIQWGLAGDTGRCVPGRVQGGQPQLSR